MEWTKNCTWARVVNAILISAQFARLRLCVGTNSLVKMPSGEDRTRHCPRRTMIRDVSEQMVNLIMGCVPPPETSSSNMNNSESNGKCSNNNNNVNNRAMKWIFFNIDFESWI